MAGLYEHYAYKFPRVSLSQSILIANNTEVCKRHSNTNIFGVDGGIMMTPRERLKCWRLIGSFSGIFEIPETGDNSDSRWRSERRSTSGWRWRWVSGLEWRHAARYCTRYCAAPRSTGPSPDQSRSCCQFRTLQTCGREWNHKTYIHWERRFGMLTKEIVLKLKLVGKEN